MHFKDFYMMERTIRVSEIDTGRLSSEEESLMRTGKELAKKYHLHYNGWQEISDENGAYTFTDKRTSHTFLVRNEDELIAKLKHDKFQRESIENLQEMPWVKTDNAMFDLRMEKPDWNRRLIDYFKKLVGQRNTEELVEILGQISDNNLYKPFFIKYYKKLPPEEQKELDYWLNKVDDEFLVRMGLSQE